MIIRDCVNIDRAVKCSVGELWKVTHPCNLVYTWSINCEAIPFCVRVLYCSWWAFMNVSNVNKETSNKLSL